MSAVCGEYVLQPECAVQLPCAIGLSCRFRDLGRLYVQRRLLCNWRCMCRVSSRFDLRWRRVCHCFGRRNQYVSIWHLLRCWSISPHGMHIVWVILPWELIFSRYVSGRLLLPYTIRPVVDMPSRRLLSLWLEYSDFMPYWVVFQSAVPKQQLCLQSLHRMCNRNDAIDAMHINHRQGMRTVLWSASICHILCRIFNMLMDLQPRIRWSYVRPVCS